MNIVQIIYGTIKYVQTKKKRKQEKLDIQGLEQGTGTVLGIGTAQGRQRPKILMKEMTVKTKISM
jgi:hypothetical protein